MFGGVLGLMACAFGWAVTMQTRLTPAWGREHVHGPSIWPCALWPDFPFVRHRACQNGRMKTLVLGVAVLGGMVLFAMVKSLIACLMVKLRVEELEFSRRELSDFGLLMEAIDAQGGSALQFLSRPEVLSRLGVLKAGALRDVIMEFGGPGKVCILGAANNDLQLVRVALSFEVSLPCLIEAIKRTTSDQIKALLESRLPGASLRPSLQLRTWSKMIRGLFRATPPKARPKQIPLRPRQSESTLDTRGIGE